MPQPVSIYIVENDERTRETAGSLLQEAGYMVFEAQSASDAFSDILIKRPDVVLTGQMLSGMDGLELTVKLRAEASLAETKIIILSDKIFDYDRRRAKEFGADGFVQKPLKGEALLTLITKLLEDKIKLRYWGVRGTLPVPGPGSIRYGGNTSCVSMAFPNDEFFIFDAGSGIKWLGNHMMGQKKRLSGKLFLSHPHWDHINALPFFTPLYVPGNQFEIFGPAQGNLSVQDLISAQMDGVYFPVTVREFGANISYRDLREEELEIGGIGITTMLLAHPGYALGYQVTYKDRKICYVTDNEFYLPESEEYNDYYVQRLGDFVRGSDLLITDACYTDDEYPKKVGWGHSAITQVARFAHDAEVKQLHLFHHDPDQDDEAIDAKLAVAQSVLSDLGSTTVIEAPAEGDEVDV